MKNVETLIAICSKLLHDEESHTATNCFFPTCPHTAAGLAAGVLCQSVSHLSEKQECKPYNEKQVGHSATRGPGHSTDGSRQCFQPLLF